MLLMPWGFLLGDFEALTLIFNEKGVEYSESEVPVAMFLFFQI